jgi:hypothetical protein
MVALIAQARTPDFTGLAKALVLNRAERPPTESDHLCAGSTISNDS